MTEAPAETFTRLRGQPDSVVLEGLHALKHALRFDADVRVAVSDRLPQLLALAEQLAPDLRSRLAGLVQPVSAAEFAALTGRPLGSPVLALARRRPVDIDRIWPAGPDPVVLLERPRHAGNAGAVVRVAAAAGARAVLITGELDPWSPPVLRSAAGLQFAVDVGQVLDVPATNRQLIALDPEGALLDPRLLAGGPILIFGGERHGISRSLLERADRVFRLPMRAQVSSLNLATSVSAVLYAWRLLR
jgi:TrmH family RNA methyltransferase